MATQSRSNTRNADTEAGTIAADITSGAATVPAVKTAPAAKLPRLGATVKVRAAAGRTVAGGARGAFSDEPETVVVTLRLLRLLEDGDLLLA